jgi:hypothetical protein
MGLVGGRPKGQWAASGYLWRFSFSSISRFSLTKTKKPFIVMEQFPIYLDDSEL